MWEITTNITLPGHAALLSSNFLTESQIDYYYYYSSYCSCLAGRFAIHEYISTDVRGGTGIYLSKHSKFTE